MATIGITDLMSGFALLEGADSFVSAMGDLSEAELKTVVGGSKSYGGGTVAIVNNIAYGFPSGGSIFGPVTNIVGGGGDD
jgi:uncharacterized spore protein YtfJ